jgi:cell division transport system permease protein
VIPLVASALRRTARIAVERPRAALWTLLALTCALVAVGVAVMAALTIDRWAATRPTSSASMVVYLGEGIADARAHQLVGELRALPGVERAELVPAEESARRLVVALGSDGTLLEGIDVASLPASVEVALQPGVRDVVAMSPTVRALRGAPGVADIVVDDRTAPPAPAPLATVRTLAWTGAALFAGLALIVVLAAIRVRLDRTRQDIAVAHLLGAGPAFVVVPTALAGALSGMVASLLATIALGIGLQLYGDTFDNAIVIPALSELAVFVALGTLIGLIGGSLAGASRVAR